MDVTFVRHGATQWNAEGRFQGQTDVPLNELGRTQAAGLASALAAESFDACVSSDLLRAYETAVAIAGELTAQRDARWREFAFGDWEGAHVSEVDAGANARLYAPPGGERFGEVRARVGAALQALREAGHKRALVVTHAGPLHAMLDILFGEITVRFEPASITQVRFEGGVAELLSVGITVRQYAERKQEGAPY